MDGRRQLRRLGNAHVRKNIRPMLARKCGDSQTFGDSAPAESRLHIGEGSRFQQAPQLVSRPVTLAGRKRNRCLSAELDVPVDLLRRKRALQEKYVAAFQFAAKLRSRPGIETPQSVDADRTRAKDRIGLLDVLEQIAQACAVIELHMPDATVEPSCSFIPSISWDTAQVSRDSAPSASEQATGRDTGAPSGQIP